MNAGKEIHVVIENVITDNASQDTSTQSLVPTSDQPAKAQSKTSGIGKAVIANAVNQAGQFALSNYGNLTGDYQTQANIQGGLEMLGLGVMALSSPVGAFAAAGTLILKGVNMHVDLVKKNRELDFLKMRTGMVGFSGGR